MISKFFTPENSEENPQKRQRPEAPVFEHTATVQHRDNVGELNGRPVVATYTQTLEQPTLAASARQRSMQMKVPSESGRTNRPQKEQVGKNTSVRVIKLRVDQNHGRATNN